MSDKAVAHRVDLLEDEEVHLVVEPVDDLVRVSVRVRVRLRLRLRVKGKGEG